MHLALKEEFSCFPREINDPFVLPYFSTNKPMQKSDDELKIEIVRQIVLTYLKVSFFTQK